MALAITNDLFGPWLSGKARDCSHMKRSKFEERVESILVSDLGIAKESIVHEIALPIRVTHELRKYMNAINTSHRDFTNYEFQIRDKIELRIDMGIALSDGAAAAGILMIEVDGGQHALGVGGASGKGSGSLFARRPADVFRALKRDALKHQLLSTVQAANPGRLAFLRIGPEYERISSRHALRSHLVTYLRPHHHHYPSPSPTLFSSCTPPLCLISGTVPPCPSLVAAPQKRSTSTRKRSRSVESARVCEMPGTKIRTRFNRYCKERIEKEMSGEAKAELMNLIKERQIASDSRKRPRDDSLFAYDPRWFKLADRWWQKLSHDSQKTL